MAKPSSKKKGSKEMTFKDYQKEFLNSTPEANVFSDFVSQIYTFRN